jgi:hypothetical protein
MKKMYPVMAQDGLTSANLRAGLSRALPPQRDRAKRAYVCQSSGSIGYAAHSTTGTGSNLTERNCVR